MNAVSKQTIEKKRGGNEFHRFVSFAFIIVGYYS